MARKCSYTEEELAKAVADSINISQVMRHLGLKFTGGNHGYIKVKILKLGLDTSHFLGAATQLGKIPSNKKSWREILVRKNGYRKEDTHRVRRAMIESGIPYRCSKCDLDDCWHNQKLVLQIDHIDGDPMNNERNNVRFLCPNCHSQTETFGAKNKKADMAKR